MFSRPQIIVGLEIGTTKVCAVVGEVNSENHLSIVGLGQAKSRGVRKGEIVDAEKVSEDVRNAIVEAEQNADVEIRSAYLGVTGLHLAGFNNRGVHKVVSKDREITEEDVQDAVRNAKAINLPAENHVIHVIRQHFRVNGQDGILNPVGMVGGHMEVEVHVVHGNLNRLQNSVRVVKALQMEVDDVVFTGMASSLSMLTNEEKEMGALVIDLGGGTTEYVAYRDGIIKHTGVLAVGGDHITNDLAYGLKVPQGRAEHLKIEHGGTEIDDDVRGRTVGLPTEVGLPERTVNLEHLRRIMGTRVEEILELVAEEIDQARLLPHLRAGVFLCGGGSRIRGIGSLAHRIFDLPVTVGGTSAVSGLQSALDQPEFAAAIGLVKFGSFQARQPARASRQAGWKGALTGWFRP